MFSVWFLNNNLSMQQCKENQILRKNNRKKNYWIQVRKQEKKGEKDKKMEKEK